MTEQECVEVFKELLDVPCEMLIKYDSVTTEEQKKALVKIRVAEEMAIKALEEIQQYRALGTVEELRVARDKQVAKEHQHTRIDRIDDCVRVSICPVCLGVIYTYQEEYPKYCSNCGQKLDWGDEDENNS